MRVSIWLLGLFGLLFIALVAAVAFLVGQNVATIKPQTSVSPSPAAAIPTAQPAPVAPQAISEQDLVSVKQRSAITGIWAFADGGCGTGYGAVYTAGGGFAEGDEFNGDEGRWTIDNGVLQRKTILRFEGDEENVSKTKKMDETDRFPIVRLTSQQLIIKDKNKTFSYVKCAGGRHVFIDGERVGAK